MTNAKKINISNTEKVKILLQENVGTQDIKKYLEIGKDQANKLRKEIENKYCKNMALARDKVPTQFFIKHMKIDIDLVFKKAKFEKELRGEI